MSALDRVPGLGGYIAAVDRNQAQGLQQLQQAQVVLGLQGAMQKQAQEQELRSALAGLDPNDQEGLVNVLAKFQPLEAAKLRQQSADRQAQIAATKEATEARLGQRMQYEDMMHQWRMAQAKTDAERAAEQARSNKAREAIQQQLAELRGQSNAVSVTEIVDPADPKRMLRIDARTYKGGSVGSPGVLGISGREPQAAKREDEKEQGRRQISEIVDSLAADYDNLQKMGALVDPKKSGVRNIYERAAASGIGQTVAGFMGTEAQQLRDSINTKRPLLIAAIKQASGMSSQMMNSNVELQFYLQAATDPTKGHETNKAALAYLDKTYGLGTGVEASQEEINRLKNQAPGLPKVLNDADYDKLPSGAEFIDPNGKKRKKP